jgi:hypothetical protein
LDPDGAGGVGGTDRFGKLGGFAVGVAGGGRATGGGALPGRLGLAEPLDVGGFGVHFAWGGLLLAEWS